MLMPIRGTHSRSEAGTNLVCVTGVAVAGARLAFVWLGFGGGGGGGCLDIMCLGLQGLGLRSSWFFLVSL